MSRYIFKIENDELVAKKEVKGVTKEFVGEDAKNKLRAIDSIKFKKVKVGSYGIILENEKTRVFIYDDVLFNEHDYQNCLYHTMKKINKAITKWNKKQNEGKSVVPGIAKGVATVGILAAIGIACASNHFKDDSFIPEEAMEEVDDDFQMDFDTDIASNIKVDNQVYASVATDIASETISNTQNDIIDEAVNENTVDYGVSSIDIPSGNSTTELLNELDQDNYNLVNVSFNDEFDEVKYNNVIRNYYGDTEERAPRWGVSTNLALSLMSQESGGYVENLMQVQWGSWADQPITVFNFEKNEYEKIVLTETPEKFQNQGITQFISKEDLKNPKTNISIGCIILRYSFDQMGHNMVAAIQAYNFGVNNMNKVLDAAAEDLGTTREELLKNQNDTSYLNYRYIIDVGDPLYVEHTLRYLQNPDEPISIRYIDDNGESQESSVVINNEQSTRSL